METNRGARVAVIMGLGAVLSTCARTSAGDGTGPLGEVVVDIVEAPPDVACLDVRITGSRTVDRQFPLTPGQTTTFDLLGLPVGSDRFDAQAFATACGTTPAPEPTWVGDPVVATVSAGSVSTVTLLLHHNGHVKLVVDFDSDDGGAPDAGSPPGLAAFSVPEPWSSDVRSATVAATSDTMLAAIETAGGFGTGTLRIDFSITVQTADESTPFVSWTENSQFFVPDCDHVNVPVPPGGALEGEPGYGCLDQGDCHLLVYHAPSRKLYEWFSANDVAGAWSGGCLVTWDLDVTYPDSLRGDQCTSASSSGLPIAPLTFSADEIASGEISHALRFSLPGDRIRGGVYQHPATSAGGGRGAATLPPMGTILRLRADYPLSTLPSEGARTVARALQKYGMVLADTGNLALSAQDDRFSSHKWSGLLTSADLQDISVADFQVLAGDSPVASTLNCVRNP